MPITTVPMGSIPDADIIGSTWAIPAFIARAATSTSGTNIMLSLNLMPTMAMPAMRPSSMIVLAENPFSSASRVRRSTSKFRPVMSW